MIRPCLALSVVAVLVATGCSAASAADDQTAAGAADLTASSCNPTTWKAAKLDVSDVAGMRCRMAQGQILQLEWQGRAYSGYIADTAEECQEILSEIRAAAWDNGVPVFAIERCHQDAGGQPASTHDLVIDSKWMITAFGGN